jgi:hypothetical protein
MRMQNIHSFVLKGGVNNTEYLYDESGIRKLHTPKQLLVVHINTPNIFNQYLGNNYSVYPIVSANFTVRSVVGYQCVRIRTTNNCIILSYDVNTSQLFVNALVEVGML